MKCAKPLSVHLHPTGACTSAMCRVEFAALFIVPSLLTLAVCVPSKPRTKFPSTKLPASDFRRSKPLRRIGSVGQVDPAIQRPLLELCLFCQSVTKEKNLKNKKQNVSVVYLHAFRFCLKENKGKRFISSLLHLAIADNRKPYRSSAETSDGGMISSFFK